MSGRTVPDPGAAIVGALLQASTAMAGAKLLAAVGDLEKRHFAHPLVGEAFELVKAQLARGEDADSVVLAEGLKRSARNGMNVGVFLGNLMRDDERLVQPAQIERWAALVREAAARRNGAPHPDDEDAEREPEAGPSARIAEALPAFLARVRHMPEPSWLVRDLVPDEGVIVWHGRPRAMKSLTAEDAMLSLALGEPHALGNQRFAIAQAVGVLLLAEEDPERLTAFRFGLMLKGRGIAPGLEPDSFRLVVRPGWDLESPAGQAELVATINATAAAMRTPLRVLVIDPARASLPSIDGGPKDAARARAFLLAILRETCIRVILLPHHDTKPTRDAKDERPRAERASGGVTFSMGDCMVSFERVNDRECLAVPVAYKVGADPKPFRVRFESETPSGQGFRGYLRAIGETVDDEGAGVRDKVFEFVKANPWSSTAEVDRGAHVRTGEAARYLAQLEAAGLVARVTGAEARARGRAPNAVLWGCP